MITDFHTHTPKPGAIVNLDPTDPEARMLPGLIYSAGIHPWNAAAATPDVIDRLEALARSPQVVAIGETGLDTLRGPAIDIQEHLFRLHIALASRLNTPIIIHCVRAWDRLLAVRRESPPVPAWIIHGFRGKPQQARQLVAAGFFLSFGHRYNPESWAATPPDRRLVESDEDRIPPELSSDLSNPSDLSDSSDSSDKTVTKSK